MLAGVAGREGMEDREERCPKAIGSRRKRCCPNHRTESKPRRAGACANKCPEIRQLIYQLSAPILFCPVGSAKMQSILRLIADSGVPGAVSLAQKRLEQPLGVGVTLRCHSGGMGPKDPQATGL